MTWEPVELLSASGGDRPPRVDDGDRYRSRSARRRSRQATFKLKARLPRTHHRFTPPRMRHDGPEARLQWSELNVVDGGRSDCDAVSAGDSLAVAEAAKLLDQNRKTRARRCR